MGEISPRILFLCATKKGYEVLLEVLRKYPETLACVCTFKEVNMQESYFEKIRTLAASTNIPLISWSQLRQNYELIVQENQIDTIIAISWKYVLPIEMNRFLKNNLMIIHDSLLEPDDMVRTYILHEILLDLLASKIWVAIFIE